eukprot:CAMPEP_0198336462 /NCGR_PEP_ID=MMETSP1450-20131203/21007_1 /TAXON_ID=753684 ORGANISM="Madagascaria erythrocladiodes, Strain CCMP3234" /NCGR_SAMPLE_ID=MMETSP1450 /ASSEMBLY_ACC=CAM_ASM_001115 /LENGTH=111 /DNA_ID=CAMNT_0044041201 /DNA_START=154 /DNA_END=486 /DNA_ORIENTATION=+
MTAVKPLFATDPMAAVGAFFREGPAAARGTSFEKGDDAAVVHESTGFENDDDVAHEERADLPGVSPHRSARPAYFTPPASYAPPASAAPPPPSCARRTNSSTSTASAGMFA